MIKMIRIMARWSSSTCRPVQLWLAREVLSSCLSRSTLSRSSLSSSYDHHNDTIIIIIIKRSVSGKCKSVAFRCENSWTASEMWNSWEHVVHSFLHIFVSFVLFVQPRENQRMLPNNEWFSTASPLSTFPLSCWSSPLSVPSSWSSVLIITRLCTIVGTTQLLSSSSATSKLGMSLTLRLWSSSLTGV